MKAIVSKFSKTKVTDEQTRPDYPVPDEKEHELSEARKSLKSMFEEMASVKSRLLFKEEEVEILKGMLAQKDEEILHLKDQLLARDRKINILRADIELAWKDFGNSDQARSSPKIRSNNHENYEATDGQEIKRTAVGSSHDHSWNKMPAPKQDGTSSRSVPAGLPVVVRAESPSPFSTFIGPPTRHSYRSTEESDITGAQMSIAPNNMD